MRAFRFLSIRRSLYGGLYLHIGRTRRLIHLGNWGRLLSITETKL